MSKGLVHVYTGHGKGKTTAALGSVLRAAGHGFSVYIIQFLKGGEYTGELIACDYLPKVKIMQFGKGCINADKQKRIIEFGKDINVRTEDCGDCRYCFKEDDEEALYTKMAFEHAKRVTKSDQYDMVILDEINIAVDKGLIKKEDVIEMIKEKNENLELILTGRNAPKELIEIADIVTEMKEVKHPYSTNGLEARKGIEY